MENRRLVGDIQAEGSKSCILFEPGAGRSHHHGRRYGHLSLNSCFVVPMPMDRGQGREMASDSGRSSGGSSRILGRSLRLELLRDGVNVKTVWNSRPEAM